MMELHGSHRRAGLRARHRLALGLFGPSVLGFCLATPYLAAQSPDPNYVLEVTNANVAQGDVFDLDVRMDNFGDPVQGWSFGICHNSAILQLLDAVDSPLTMTVKNGEPPDFDVLTQYEDGFTKAVLICFLGCATLDPGIDLHLNTGTYQVIAPGPLTTLVEPCSTLGAPVVPVKVVVDGTTIDMTRAPGTVEIFAGDPPVIHTFVGGEDFCIYDPATGVTDAQVPLYLLESPLSPNFPNEVMGFHMSLRHDSSHMTATEVDMGADLMALNGGSGPDFYAAMIHAEGVTLEAAMDGVGSEPLVADTLREVARVGYDSVPIVLIFNPFGVHDALEWDSSVAPPAANEIEVDAPVSLLLFDDGMVHFVPKEKFVRGDANDDGAVEISDVLVVLDRVFSGDPLFCDDAADANDDSSLNVADAVAVLDYLFRDGSGLPAPFPTCDWDGTGVGDCLVYNSCP